MAAADDRGRGIRRGRDQGREVSGFSSERPETLLGSNPEQARSAGTTAPSLSKAETWPLKRYGRFVTPEAPRCGEGASASWKVLESNEESGHLILTIVVSGHFFVSQRRAVLTSHILKALMPSAALLGYFMGFEGFSLIDAHKWLKIVRRADCLLFGSKFKEKRVALSESTKYTKRSRKKGSKRNASSSKSRSFAYTVPCENECRMFRIQFGGDSKEQALEHCYSCVQKLADYVTVQVTDEQSQELHQGHSQLANSESQVKNSDQNTSMLHGPSQVIDIPPAQSSKSFPGRKSVTELAQSVLKSSTFELPFAYQHSVWSAEELGPFIRLCLMDQNFPAFVEEVEKELKKLTED